MMPMSDERVSFERATQGVGVITLNNPTTMNALDTKMVQEFRKHLAAVGSDPAYADIRCLILTGAGRAFCAGLYLNPELLKKSGVTLEQNLPEGEIFGLVEEIRTSRVPIIAAVNGVAVGAGLSLMIACDFALAADGAKFASAFTDRGLIPDLGATYILPRLLGKSPALRFILCADRIDAPTALTLGLVQEVVVAEQLTNRAVALALLIAGKPPLAIRLARQAIWASYENSYADQIELEKITQRKLGESLDFGESVAAFLEKRVPIFRGM
jgi:2-(1,2-epoxy-1,2-dihydrophenyl)acetyl-CoA isomerase